MSDSGFPRNTTPCLQCGTPTLTVRRRYGAGVVTLDVSGALRCYQLVIHGTGDAGIATAAESMAYPAHGPICRGPMA